MERSRSKRSYYYDQDYGSRTKPRYRHHYSQRRANGSRPPRLPEPPPPPPPPPLPSGPVSISYRILCPDVKAGGVIGKSGSIIKAFRQETGAWINVHPLVPGDEERIIEISDAGPRESYSPAQEALLLVHDRIIDCEAEMGDGGVGYGGETEEEDAVEPRAGGGVVGRIASRLIVPRAIVGCILGKAGKIIEQMRAETRTQIRVLPRDHKLPRCVSLSEEIVQVVGDGSAVKKAVAIIASRLKEAMLRKGGTSRGRLSSPERYYPPDDDFGPPMNSAKSTYAPHQSSYGYESPASSMVDNVQAYSGEDLVFQILCPNDKVESVMGESSGIIQTLQADIGVDVKISDPLPGSDERIIIISSDEGPDDELFPAQEALLHVQNCIVDLGPDKDNIITTRLLVPADEVVCLGGVLSEMVKMSHANIQILPRDELPSCASDSDELVQIVGDIMAAREAVIQITSKIRGYLYRDPSFARDTLLPGPPLLPGQGHSGMGSGIGATSPIKNLIRDNFTRDNCQGSELPPAESQNIQTALTAKSLKDNGRSGSASVEQEAEEGTSVLNRFHAPIVTKSTLEVIIPDHAVPSLTMRSGSKLAQISEMSGAAVSFVEDKPDRSQKVIQISGAPEQAERAQSLLQGFILSTQ